MNLIYMAKPRFGGWVTFTAHLSKKYNYKLYKIHTKTEVKKKWRPYIAKLWLWCKVSEYFNKRCK